jgi:LPXTG-motif cell wall-anchored protein
MSQSARPDPRIAESEMVKKALAIGVVVLVGVIMAVVTSGPASAQQYGGCQAVLGDSTPRPGEKVTVSGTGSEPNGTVTASLASGPVIGTGTADANGAFRFQATIPADQPLGQISITVTCGARGGAAVLGVQITQKPGTGGGGTAVTGSSSTIPLTKLGISLVALGGLLLALSRRKRVGASASASA